MLEQTPQRQYEGPARLSDSLDEKSLREQGKGISKSYASYLTDDFGPEGIGWGFETDTDRAQHNELEKVSHAPEFALGTEALNNAFQGKGYKLNDGTDVTGRVTRYALNPPMGNVVVFPDGDIYNANKLKKRISYK